MEQKIMAGHELPEPPIPAYLDLRKTAYMSLAVRQLRDSRLAAECDGDTFKAAVLLWCASWHQVPAGSLPNNERELTMLCGLGKNVQKFRAISGLVPAELVSDPNQGYDLPPRQVAPRGGVVAGGVWGGVMAGWVLCRDGRYYHPLISELAVNSWNWSAKRNYQLSLDRLRKNNKDRVARGEPPVKLTPPETVVYRWEKKVDSAGIPPELDAPQKKSSGGIPHRVVVENSSSTKTHKVNPVTDDQNPSSESGGNDAGVLQVSSTPPAQNEAVSKSKTAPRPPPKSVVQRETEVYEANREALTTATWKAYADAYFGRYQQEPLRNATVNGMMTRFVQRIGRESAPFVAAFYVTMNNSYYVKMMHTPGPMVKDAEAIYAQWVNRSKGIAPMTAAKAAQIDRTQAGNDAFENMIAEVDGSGKTAEPQPPSGDDDMSDLFGSPT